MREMPIKHFLDIKRITNANRTKTPKIQWPDWWLGPFVVTAWEIQLDNNEWYRVFYRPWSKITNRCIIIGNERVCIDIRRQAEIESSGIPSVIKFIREAIHAMNLQQDRILDLEEVMKLPKELSRKALVFTRKKL